MHETLITLIRASGFLQWSVLVASAMVPVRLDWSGKLAALPRLLRQLYWTYGGYVVLMITALGLLCALFPAELASGSPLARAVCSFIALFWGIRAALQLLLDARPYLTAWWLWAGEGILTAIFLALAVLFAYAAAVGPSAR